MPTKMIKEPLAHHFMKLSYKKEPADRVTGLDSCPDQLLTANIV